MAKNNIKDRLKELTKKELIELCKSLSSTAIMIYEDCGCDTEMEDTDILEEDMRRMFPKMFIF